MLAGEGWLRTRGMASRPADLQLAPSTYMTLGGQFDENTEVDMVRTLASVMVLMLLSMGAAAQSAAKKPVEGAWKVVEVVVTGANASSNPSPQPNLYIFTQSHYSMMSVPGTQARTLFKAVPPTTDEKIPAFDSFVGNTGTYELAGSVLTVRAIVARYPNYMAGGYSKYQVRVEGNTLWLTQKSTDVYSRVGDKVVASSGAASETRLKLVRLE